MSDEAQLYLCIVIGPKSLIGHHIHKTSRRLNNSGKSSNSHSIDGTLVEFYRQRVEIIGLILCWLKVLQQRIGQCVEHTATYVWLYGRA